MKTRSPFWASTRITSPGDEVALEQPDRERVLEQALDRALQRAGAVGRIPARVADRRLRRVGQLELEPALGETVAQPLELQLDDLAQLVAGQRA